MNFVFHSQGKHTALHIAVEAKEKEIVEHLVMKGAETDLQNDVRPKNQTDSNA